MSSEDDPIRQRSRVSVAAEAGTVPGHATRRHGTTVFRTNTGTTKRQNKEADDEGDRRDGPGCGNDRDDAGGAARAAGSDKRRRRSGSLVGIRSDRADMALDLDRSPGP